MKTTMTLLTCLLATLLLTGCRNLNDQSAPAPVDNALLTTLAEEDQAERHGQEVERTDKDRRMLVMRMLAAGEVVTPRDKFHAGLILQHTGLTFCGDRLTSLSPENYLLAHELLKQAFEGGLTDKGWLVAATIDRYLGYTAGYQKYGTNRLINQETGVEELFPIDRSVGDEERAKYGVPPLEELLARFPEMKQN